MGRHRVFPDTRSLCFRVRRSTLDGMHEYDEPELIRPEDLLGRRPLPADARRMGFDRNTEEGAMIALAASLDPAKLSHRLAAWLMLVVILLPLFLTLAYELL